MTANSILEVELILRMNTATEERMFALLRVVVCSDYSQSRTLDKTRLRSWYRCPCVRSVSDETLFLDEVIIDKATERVESKETKT